MEFPLWAVFALLCASFSALVLILPERFRADGFAVAFWNKAFAIVFMIPLVVLQGLPDQWEFYALVAAQAMLWVVSDVIFFRALPEVGAGVVSRILPISVIVTFCAWFLFDHDLFAQYLDTPVRSGLVCAALAGSVYFATRLKKDPVSWAAIRRIWFVLFAAVIGPLMYKLVTKYTTIEQGPFAFVMFEAMVMVFVWSVFYGIKKPVPVSVLFSKESLRAGACVGAAMCLVSLTKFAAMHYVDNPGLVPAVKYLDAIIVMAYYKAIGKIEKADVVAGLGIVACAAAIIVLRST
ncbi:MAG: hypothetical protein DI551_02660 [Micavibrio aeruginosavorus]|uniref:EamA domain-containing protein n=1 Tax=Micavibrio aeruginosavorus TaxID=349221 RepID=A0A2W5PZF2_9BACT|nr:MAG: hypothetical protein DI551_02660 [Micavibrio aeruginosavorus]